MGMGIHVEKGSGSILDSDRGGGGLGDWFQFGIYAIVSRHVMFVAYFVTIVISNVLKT